MKRFLIGWFFGMATVLGCASAPIFPYKYYTPQLDPDVYDSGELLGKLGNDGWPDHTFSDCKPDAIPSPSPSGSPTPSPVLDRCVVMMTPDFYSMKAKYETCQNDLAACQQGPAPQ